MKIKIIPKQLWKEYYEYYSYKPLDELHDDIKKLLDKTYGFNFSVNLTGRFVSENEFKMTPKWSFTNIQFFEHNISYLRGKLYLDDQSITRVDFNIRPNSILVFFFFIFIVLGVVYAQAAFLEPDNNEENLPLAIVCGIVSLSQIPIGYFSTRGIKKRFISTFNLKPITRDDSESKGNKFIYNNIHTSKNRI